MLQKEKIPINYEKIMFAHFPYCSSMKLFPEKFHQLWVKYFEGSPINEVMPILGTRNVDNLQRRLVQTKLKNYYYIINLEDMSLWSIHYINSSTIRCIYHIKVLCS
ncbi:unnamed protein product [Rotaria magnacalcarata]|uniref:Uncharacterized protein n=2 Tax=Rotaria magnacalcarata TaxID=392030 RepID=A0A814X497_9BILA|nr:unnamed protein product [Rotaria magnacalcarata]CAF1640739.1 unnamed protein product [Rotaria magnacalcarata]CAF4082854.1 unnamed protein product [Rotaria magnacalcarata]